MPTDRQILKAVHESILDNFEDDEIETWTAEEIGSVATNLVINDLCDLVETDDLQRVHTAVVIVKNERVLLLHDRGVAEAEAIKMIVEILKPLRRTYDEPSVDRVLESVSEKIHTNPSIRMCR